MTGVRDAAAVVVAASKSAQMPDLVSDDHPFMRALLENREERAIAMLPEQSAATPYPMPSHALARVVYKRATAWRKLGIRLNVITSGPTQTRIFPESTEISLDSPGVSATPLPLGRRARPEEIARMIRSLLCGDASSLRGSNMRGDDGADSTMRPETF
jgi:NAD(P)-dependent dehydrogenase (short-subunit alcohol dehydrogenase family)